MRSITRIVAAIALGSGLAAAAAPPVEILRRITPEQYPDANAVVVFDSTLVTLSSDGRNVTRTHKLVKILTEEGKRQYAATWNEYCLTYSKAEVRLARVIAPDGRVANVARKDIVDVPSPLWEGSKFVLPNVRVKSIQFPGLALGSSVEWIAEEVTHNPVMEGQYDDAKIFSSFEPVLDNVYTIDVPATMKLRWLVKSGSVDTSFTVKGNRRRMTWSAHDVPKLVYEPMMPYVESSTRLLVCTQPDWQTWSRWYYNLCSTQYEVDSSLARATDSLAAGTATEDAKVRALYNFVDQRIRYVETSYSGRKAGYQPERISLTFQKRYGVCRDKAALLVGMLRHVGVDAYITLTNGGTQTDAELPVDQFNHATVAVKRPDGSIYYLDPTVENSRQYLAASEMNRGVLIATASGDDLRFTPVEPADSNRLEALIVDTLAADGSLSGTVTLNATGYQDLRWRSSALRQAPQQEKQTMERHLRMFGPSARLDTMETTDPADLNVPFVVKLRFRVPDFATVLKPKGSRGTTIRFTLPRSGSGMFGASSLTWTASMPVRRYPIDLHATQSWHLVHEMTLPRGFKTALVPDPLERAQPRFEAKSVTRARGRALTNEAWFRLNDPLIPVAEYQDLRGLLSATEEIERQHVMLKTGEE